MKVIYCGVCRQRLFDAETAAQGRIEIEIKCPRCRQIQRIRLAGAAGYNRTGRNLPSSGTAVTE